MRVVEVQTGGESAIADGREREREREIKKLKRERERERARTTTVQKRVNEMKTGAKRERGSVVFELKQEEQ